jgi:2-polyprenyl-3-methyl-5-hydroxy-6-metoxy-1,4-benzoquinol methylase
MNRIPALVFLSAILAATCSYFWRLESMPYFLEFEAKTSSNYTSQLFVDYGNGYSEEGSVKQQILPSNAFKKIRFYLKSKEINFLRFDPFISDGEMEIKSICIRGRKQILNEYEIHHEFDISQLRAIQNVEVKKTKDKTIIVNSSVGNIDPILELPIATALNHWEFKDLLDEEWLKKAFFLFLTCTPIIISLSFLPVTKAKTLSSLKFSIRKDEIILKKGQKFTCSNSKDHYRDTNEENLNSIIKSIEQGKEWRSVIKEKIASSNPWLNSIATSPKRTKFIEDFLKPHKLSVLDIGAGWGQFSIPLAKSNKVCSIEPTPERLDIIKIIAQQEQVSDDMYFIGADYLDINFQTKFDLILCIGVLEWVGKFTNSAIPPETAQFEFLKKTKKDLNEEGKLVIGIENRLGLKYLLGTNDDHTGLPFISCFNKGLAKRKYKQKTNKELQCFTYSLWEYESLLLNAGFSEIRFFAALPDYKLPKKIFSISNDHTKCGLNKFIMEGGKIKDHDGSNGKKLYNQDEIYSMYQTLAEMNLSHYFSPSFFIEAS